MRDSCSRVYEAELRSQVFACRPLKRYKKTTCCLSKWFKGVVPDTLEEYKVKMKI